jgi:cobalt-zinc-cadmium efflux system membrane fusion protein
MRTNVLALMCGALVLGQQACSRDTKPGKADTSADTSMANMPGMPGMANKSDSSSAGAESNSITFTSAQIAHGRIAWAVPTSSTMSGTVEVPGQLVVNEDRTSRLAAPAQARVLAVHVSPGDRVSRGDRLVTLQSQDASMAQADVAKAQAEVSSRRAAAAYAKTARDRAERLLSLKAIPRQDYERAIADDELARAALSQAEAELTRARAGAEQLGVDLQTGAMILRSPIGGVVITRDAVPGAVVGAGTTLVTVTDPTTLWLTVALPEQLVGAIRVGSSLRFTVAAFPNDTFTARVQSVSASFDPATRSLPVRGIVSNVGGRRLRPEMFAKVWVVGGARQSAIIVPDSAIQRVDGKPVVFVAHPDGKGGARFEKRIVQIGASAGGSSTVTAGLSAGEAIVVRGAYAVKAELAKGKMPKMEM